MKEIKVKVYKFSELSDKAKEVARNHYKEEQLDFRWWESTYDDAKEAAALMGIEIDDIGFSGFWSQGDGAHFEGSYKYRAGAVKAVKEHAPEDTTLHEIAQGLVKVQRPEFYQLRARVKHRGHYQHENCTEIQVYNEEFPYREVPEDEIKDLLRDFMRWIYKKLEKEYDWLTEDEQIEESIESFELEFYEDGSVV